MKIITPLAISAFALGSAPALAADEPAPTSAPVSDNAPVAVDRDGGAAPPNWRRINHKLNKRAKNAVENGASPARVRHKLQAHKRKLYRRWKASQ